MEEKADRSKKVRRIFLLCALIIGLSMIIYSYVQPTITATITSLGKVSSRSVRHRTKSGSHETSTYYVMASVTWQEGEETREEKVDISFENGWAPPRVGTQIEMVQNPLGAYVSFPDRVLRRLGIFIPVAAIVLDFIYLFIIRDYLFAQKDSRKSSSGTLSEPEKEVKS